MEDTVHCEDQLKTTLHCDDKEKLRRKLALLQREYLRTAQKLQRAERLDAVRKHVRSKIPQQKKQDQRDPQVTSNPCPNPSTSSLTLDAHNGAAPGEPHGQENTGGPADSDNSRRSQVIGFLPPTDVSCPATPDSAHEGARCHRQNPALRLRSRSSRLRWERRSAEAGRSTDNSEEGQEQSEPTESRTERDEETVKPEGTEVVNESEELFSAADSESPSLLLSHWNTQGHEDTGEMPEGEEKREKENEVIDEGSKTSSLLPVCRSPAVHSEGGRQDFTQNQEKRERKRGEEGEDSRGQKDDRLCEENSNKNTEQHAGKKTDSEQTHDVEIKVEKSGMGGDEKGAGLLDSCTIVEGLLFPVEYYVRTTRRMASSQSQPDMQAIHLSQLITGRCRRGRGQGRGRGRGRGSHRHTHNDEHSDQHIDSSSLTPARPHTQPQASDTPAELNQSSGETSDQISLSETNTNAFSSPTVCTARPGRGGRRKRGRGRGKPGTPRCSLSSDTHHLSLEQTSDDPQPTNTPLSSSDLSLHAADRPKPCLTPEETVPVLADVQPASTPNTATHHPSEVNGAPSSAASGQQGQVYSIFLKSSNRTNRSSQRNTSADSWQSYLLPSSPPSQTSLFPLPSLFSVPLISNQPNFDMHQDFHLPDDQFASLKLHKLRRVAVESGVEHFSSPSCNTRSSNRRFDSQCSNDPVAPLLLPLSLTPTVEKSPHPNKEKEERKIKEDNLTDELTSPSSAEELLGTTDAPGEQQTDNLNTECQSDTNLTESAVNCVEKHTEKDPVTLNCQISVSDSNAHSPVDPPVKSEISVKFKDEPAGKESDTLQIKHPASEEETHCSVAVHHLEDERPTNHQKEDKAFIKSLSFSDCPPQESPEGAPNNCTAAAQACSDTDATEESPVKLLKSFVKDLKEPSEPTTNIITDRLEENKNQEKPSPHHSVNSQLLLSPPLASAPCPFVTPHKPLSALLSSPTLPSLGLTPHPLSAVALPLTCSPSAPSLTLPPLHSPSTQALSPPALSPCASLPPVSLSSAQIHTLPEIPAVDDPLQTGSDIQVRGRGGQVGARTTDEHMRKHTLEAPAGGCLVDTCCLLGSSGSLCVAAAGKWAVCLWSQTSASDWSLTHTWTFNEPVINVFPVPDAAGLMCVTLGQLEIREMRMLSCSSLSHVLLCEGVIQAVVGVPRSRVVSSSYSAAGSTLQVFTLSDSDSTHSCQPLVSPGVCVGAMAPVDGLPDALIGTDEDGCLFVWNLKTGQLLRRIVLGDGLSHTACLRGYSSCGVLLVLLQHQFLRSLEEEEKETKAEEQMFLREEEKEEERCNTALFSLVAVNPLSGKSVPATRLYPPKAWSGSLCEADVNSSSVVGLSQSGCVCVWELGRRGESRMVWAPESEGWQLARWGCGDTLMTGHHNGDITLHLSLK
ncbi:partner and localizer of BRCA2 [Scomber japonicus]|uniref:partner and localizer of BRCA2 n=1 Tax=Scomber japonicus TaxID=13676 RepID=UPI0023055B22|nr:partner and localizer of BRCA2 [Scomber japonicus]